MSWLARSIANSLHLVEDDDLVAQNDSARLTHPEDGGRPGDQYPENIISKDEGEGYVEDRSLYGNDDDNDGDNWNNLHGLKEDLSEFKEQFTRQLRGVASFLAPPPPPPPPPLPGQKLGLLCSESKLEKEGLEDEEEEEEEGELGECGEGEPGQFGDHSNLLQSEDYYMLEDAVGITEEVLAFARNIAHHPETWLDFPLSDEEEFDDFNLSDAQVKHALGVEHLAQRLAALRYELCPAHMSEGFFWMVYFVLLHSRLNKHDADLLSTPQLVEARAMWMQELQKRTKAAESDWFGSSTFYSKESIDSPREIFSASSYEDAHYGNISGRMVPFDSMACQATNDCEIEKHPLESNEIEFIDKSVIEEDPASKPVEKEIDIPSIELQVQDYNDDDDDDDDDWLKEDPDLVECSGTTIFGDGGDGEDVSFSDLEDDIDCTMPVKSKIVSSDGNKQTKTS